ncbi:MAG TPA: hypothetical protein VFI65_30725 [Streptosporangiaceae bacterium]|nr:hypothetical protein [Streptosporangiaceae bacterium]
MRARTARTGLVAALLGASALAASALAASSPAFAARTAGPSQARIGTGIHPRLNLSVLPGPARVALAPAGKSRNLFGVFCNSASDCWAVGEIRTATTTVNQILHWTGKKWFPVKVPNQAGTAKDDENELFAVRCTSLKNCWAVGDSQQPGSVAQLDQAMHYDGKSWALASMPAPGGTSGGAFNTLEDLACTSAKNCWAVGEYGLIGTSMQPQVGFNQVLHFDGRQWMFMKTPNPGGINGGHINALDSVRCTTPTSCWAVGTDGSILNGPNLRNEILFSNGKKWTTVNAPDPASIGKLHVNILNFLACTAKPDCWAVGVAGNLNGKKQFEHNEALHWTGKTWVVVKTPNPDKTSDELFGIACVAAQDCWAVGSVGGDPSKNEAMHWNGAKWSLVPTVNGAGRGKDIRNNLASVRCTSHSNCWAVGYSQSGGKADTNQIEHWNGTKWSGS